jgi:hypothetical protein
MSARSIRSSKFPVRQLQLLGGLGLAMAGLFVLVGNTGGTVRVLGLIFMLGLGLIFVLWGMIAGAHEPMIPGALLSGVSLGTLLTQEVYALSSLQAAGVHALSIAAGFGLITLLTGLFASSTLWWPLIPAGILLLGGINLLLGEAALASIGDFWPLAMIVSGTYLVWRSQRSAV